MTAVENCPFSIQFLATYVIVAHVKLAYGPVPQKPHLRFSILKFWWKLLTVILKTNELNVPWFHSSSFAHPMRYTRVAIHA